MTQTETHITDPQKALKQAKQAKQFGLLLGILSFLIDVVVNFSSLKILITSPEFGSEKAAILWGTAFLKIGFGVFLFLLFAVGGYYRCTAIEEKVNRHY